MKKRHIRILMWFKVYCFLFIFHLILWLHTRGLHNLFLLLFAFLSYLGIYNLKNVIVPRYMEIREQLMTVASYKLIIIIFFFILPFSLHQSSLFINLRHLIKLFPCWWRFTNSWRPSCHNIIARTWVRHEKEGAWLTIPAPGTEETRQKFSPSLRLASIILFATITHNFSISGRWGRGGEDREMGGRVYSSLWLRAPRSTVTWYDEAGGGIPRGL